MNTSLEDYKRFMEAVSKETGIAALLPDETGLVSVNVDNTLNMNFQFSTATGRILCFAEVGVLPADTPKEVYRDLLAAGLFGKETAGGYFALERESDIVVYNYEFDLEEASKDIGEFISTIEKIIQLCDLWSERIKSASKSRPADYGMENNHSTFFHIQP